MRLVLTVPPAIEPVSLAQCHAQLRIPSSFTSDDDYITSLIPIARRFFEQRSHLCLINQQWTIFMDGWDDHQMTNVGNWGGGNNFYTGYTLSPVTIYNDSYKYCKIRLPHGPVSSVLAVEYVDQSQTLQTWDMSNYDASLGNPAFIYLLQNQVYPVVASQADTVQISYVAGYGTEASDVDPLAIEGILLIVERLYEFRGLSHDSSLTPVPIGLDDLISAVGVGANLFF